MIASPLNYTGGKHRLLPQIIPLFPDDINCFYDLFGGGGNVAVNVNAKSVVYNDLSLPVVQMLETFRKTDISDILQHIDHTIETYGLSKENSGGYLKLRSDYNKSADKNPLTLYSIIAHSFNNQIRFNSKGEFNLPFGKGRSSFNSALREKVITFCKALQSKDFRITNADFREFDGIDFQVGDFVYCDPPYLASSATYNDGRFVRTAGGIVKHHWTEQDESALYDFLRKLTAKNVRWALSNNLSCNKFVEQFANENAYKIHELSADYSNCNYHKKDKSKAREVLITNY